MPVRPIFAPTHGGDVPSVADPRAMSVLESVAATTSCRRGEDIYLPGDEARYWYRVSAGLVRTYADSANGNRQIVDFLMPGDFFGFSAAEKHHFGTNVAMNGTVIARYPRRRLEVFVDTDPELARLILDIAFKAISHLQDRTLVLGRTTAREKVVAFLIEMAGRCSDHAAEVVLLPMSRYDIADYLAISVETVSRALSHLKQCGIISIANRRQIKIVERASLMEMAISAGIATAE